MRWIRYTKTKGKQTNFFELEWNTKLECVIAKVEKDGKTYGLALMDKEPFNTWHLYSVSDLRIPIVINRSSSLYNMAMNTMIYNNRVTEKNARNEVFMAMGKDEILIDWSKGHAYWRVGYNTVKRFEVKDYYITDKRKLLNWHVSTKETNDDE